MDLFLQQLKLRDEYEKPKDQVDSNEFTTLRSALEVQVETSRHLNNELVKCRTQIAILERQTEEKDQIAKEKNKSIEVLQDELFTVQLELSQAEKTISRLQEENKNLIDRWISRINSEAAMHV